MIRPIDIFNFLYGHLLNFFNTKPVPSSKRTQQKGTFVLTVLGTMATDANAKNAFNEQQINYAQGINLGTFATQVKLEAKCTKWMILIVDFYDGIFCIKTK